MSLHGDKGPDWLHNEGQHHEGTNYNPELEGAAVGLLGGCNQTTRGLQGCCCTTYVHIVMADAALCVPVVNSSCGGCCWGSQIAIGDLDVAQTTSNHLRVH